MPQRKAFLDQIKKKERENKRRLTFEEALAEWDRILEPEYEEDRNCTQLSAKDFSTIGSIRWKL